MRHPQHDYSTPGAYFITFVTKDRENSLGRISDGAMELSVAGRVVEHCWLRLPQIYQGLILDAFQVMPDHVHCILSFVPKKKMECS
jgi:REP element-mobilizing transposase RayT